jgi:hypothetical protein
MYQYAKFEKYTMDNSNAGPLLFTLGFKKAYFRNGSIEMN